MRYRSSLAEEVDAVVLAAAGVRRIELDLGELQAFDLPLDDFVPAPGQGALAIETRADDALFAAVREALHDEAVARCTDAERQTLHGLGAGCSVPLGAHAVPLDGGELRLQLDSSDSYRFEFELGGERCGAVEVESGVAQFPFLSAMHEYRVKLPREVRATGFDAILIRGIETTDLVWAVDALRVER